MMIDRAGEKGGRSWRLIDNQVRRLIDNQQRILNDSQR